MGEELLLAVLLDEMEIQLLPVLLADGRRLFDHLGSDQHRAGPRQGMAGTAVMHLRYRVLKGAR